MDTSRKAITKSKQYNSKDLAQLSMIQIMTLHKISRHTEPIIRHSLLLELNDSFKVTGPKNITPEQAFSDSLHNIPKPLISPSSFYTSLQALEKKGLVSFNRNKKGKIKSVEKTPLTDNFLNFIHQYFLINMLNDHNYNVDLIKILIDQLKTHKFSKNNILTILPFDIPYMELLIYLSSNFENLYLIGNQNVETNLQSKQIFDINFSKIKNRQIREPENDFDVVIIQAFNQLYNFYDLSFEKLIKELVRITKPNSIIFVFAQTELFQQESSPRKNMLFKDFISNYNDLITKGGKLLTKSELNKILLSVSLKDLEIIEHEGLIIGIGKV
jgi:hypothetical protein